MPKRRHERPQPGNPHGLTIGQHVHSRWCIAQFADGAGEISVLRRANPVPFETTPENKIFCALRVWDEQAEHGTFKKAEDAFHSEVDRIVRGGAVGDHEAITRYLATWEIRSRFKEAPPEDLEISGVPESRLTKDQEEILESRWVKFRRGTSIPGRHLANVRALVLTDQLMERYRGIRWGIARTLAVPGFICPDRPASQAYIPIDRRHALVAEWKDQVLGPQDVERLNRDSWSQARDLIFGHRDDVAAFARSSALAIVR